MGIRNTRQGYGAVARAVHWAMAIAVPAMFGLGYWMVSLDYYDPWYRDAPFIHKSVGILLLALLAFRFLWRLVNPSPRLNALRPWERRLAQAVHWGFYPLLLVLMVSGYLISTADGRPIEVFGWFSVPSLVQDRTLGDTAGLVHEYAAYAAIALMVLHAAGGLKHHFIDKGDSLRRMTVGAPPPRPQA